jgi:putative ABC transport system substrate-binding protein
VPRIALVFANTPVGDMTGPRPTEPTARAFLEAMRELGWSDGQNSMIERESAEGHPDRYAGLAQELLSLKLSLMVCSGASLTRAMAQATNGIPIVMAGAFADPVAEAGVKSLARPGGNLTGLTVSSSDTLQGKRLELLKEAFPGISRVAFLGKAIKVPEVCWWLLRLRLEQLFDLGHWDEQPLRLVSKRNEVM